MQFFTAGKQEIIVSRANQLVWSSALVLFSLMSIPHVRADEEDRSGVWYFTAEEISAAYQYQESYGERLRNPLRAAGCMFGGGEFAARHGKTTFTESCRFVRQVTRHLKEMIDAGAAKFLFPLDADHAHFGVPTTAWKEKYQHLFP